MAPTIVGAPGGASAQLATELQDLASETLDMGSPRVLAAMKVLGVKVEDVKPKSPGSYDLGHLHASNKDLNQRRASVFETKRQQVIKSVNDMAAESPKQDSPLNLKRASSWSSFGEHHPAILEVFEKEQRYTASLRAHAKKKVHKLLEGEVRCKKEMKEIAENSEWARERWRQHAQARQKELDDRRKLKDKATEKKREAVEKAEEKRREECEELKAKIEEKDATVKAVLQNRAEEWEVRAQQHRDAREKVLQRAFQEKERGLNLRLCDHVHGLMLEEARAGDFTLEAGEAMFDACAQRSEDLGSPLKADFAKHKLKRLMARPRELSEIRALCDEEFRKRTKKKAPVLPPKHEDGEEHQSPHARQVEWCTHMAKPRLAWTPESPCGRSPNALEHLATLNSKIKGREEACYAGGGLMLDQGHVKEFTNKKLKAKVKQEEARAKVQADRAVHVANDRQLLKTNSDLSDRLGQRQVEQTQRQQESKGILRELTLINRGQLARALGHELDSRLERTVDNRRRVDELTTIRRETQHRRVDVQKNCLIQKFHTDLQMERVKYTPLESTKMTQLVASFDLSGVLLGEGEQNGQEEGEAERKQ